MLKSLHIVDFALIVEETLEFGPGLNILTGETGAGKSIIIGAFGMVLGNRASADLVRQGCDHFLVEAVFEHLSQELGAFLAEHNIETDDDVLIISRRFAAAGKNTVLVNGSRITLQTLRHLGALLVDIHGQHENQSLLRQEIHLALLDASSADTQQLKVTYNTAYRHWQEVTNKLAALERDARTMLQQQDILTWQTGEIETAALKPGEDDAVEEELRILSNAEKIANAVTHAYNLLEAGSEGSNGIMADLGTVSSQLETAGAFDSRLQAMTLSINDSLYSLEEITRGLRDYIEQFEFDQGRLDFLQQRLDTIYTLKKKYGGTIEEITAYYQQAKQQLDTITNYDSSSAALKAEQTEAFQVLQQNGRQLHKSRQAAAKVLAAAVTNQLHDLAMPQARFAVDLKDHGYVLDGTDGISFMFSANRGEELKPLIRVASGGELSRLALAIKTVSTMNDDIGTMVFDEVDAGIGGETAQKVAERIARAAVDKQVMCITHLPQIACMADRHFHIEKTEAADRTNSNVYELDDDGRLNELAKMISGSEAIASSKHTAAEMLQMARKKKKLWCER